MYARIIKKKFLAVIEVAALAGAIIGGIPSAAFAATGPQATSTAAEYSDADAVSCISTNDCIAVGDYENSNHEYVPLAQHWNGSVWKSQTIPAGGPISTFLFGVSCSSKDNCIAVGQTEVSASPFPNATPFAEQWNGSSWHVLPSPQGTTPGILYSAACVSKTDCFVAGNYSPSAPDQSLPLIENWNGKSWTTENVPSPIQKDPTVSLSSISCSSANSCTAVGSYSSTTGGNSTVYVTAWNGKTWSNTKVPVPDSAGAGLLNVSCPTAKACVAVGSYKTTSGSFEPFSLVEKNSVWTVAPTATTSNDTQSELVSISCIAADNCTAVGDNESSFSSAQTLAEKWNGTTWTVETTPNSKDSVNYLDAVSCASANNCVAVGNHGAGLGQPAQLFSLISDGSSWKVSNMPQPSA